MRFAVRLIGSLAALAVVCSCQTDGGIESKEGEEPAESVSVEEAESTGGSGEERGSRAPAREPVQPDVGEGREVATFAGGCFWCMEKPFEKRRGVHEVVSGYCGGDEKDPEYERVAKGKTDHAESVQIVYDPDKISFDELLHIYWRQIDPTDDGGQFVDRGPQYRPVIFYHDERQKTLAERTREKLSQSGPFDEPIVVDIVPATKFWRASDYHQDFYKTHSKRYKSYRRGSGRDEFLDKHWRDD